MISIILYGRNDSHGYNLHKRAAISLNCMAEILGEDSEIIFVDWNTPLGLPTFPEAIIDTLTDKCKRLLKIYRVSPKLHNELANGKTSKTTLEPIARNVAIRRSNQKNKWILSTNTDMIFLNEDNITFMDKLRTLQDGSYASNRYSIPDGIWESFDRHNPIEIFHTIRELMTSVDLLEVVRAGEIQKFDAPGDFQLVERKVLIEIGGFDERMLRGWHVDSNLAKRLHIYYGETKVFNEKLMAFHCEHTRMTTHFHTSKSSNDLYTFYESVNTPHANVQDINWGLKDIELHEINLTQPLGKEKIELVKKTTRNLDPKRSPVHTSRMGSLVTYPFDHALPYILDNLEGYEKNDCVVYLGNQAKNSYRLGTILSTLNGITLKSYDASSFSDVNILVENTSCEIALIVDFGHHIPESFDISNTYHSDFQYDFHKENLKILDALFNYVINSKKANVTKFIFLNAETYGFGIGSTLKSFFDIPNSAANFRVRAGVLNRSFLARNDSIKSELISRKLSSINYFDSFNEIELQKQSKITYFKSHELFKLLNKECFEINSGGTFLSRSKGEIKLSIDSQSFHSIGLEIDVPFSLETRNKNYSLLFWQGDIKYSLSLNFKTGSKFLYFDSTHAEPIKFELLNVESEVNDKLLEPLGIRFTNLTLFRDKSDSLMNKNLNSPSFAQMKWILNSGWSFSNENNYRWIVNNIFEIDLIGFRANSSKVYMHLDSFIKLPKMNDFKIYYDSIADDNIICNEFIKIHYFGPRKLLKNNSSIILEVDFRNNNKLINKLIFSTNVRPHEPFSISLKDGRTLFFKLINIIFSVSRFEIVRKILFFISSYFHVYRGIIYRLLRRFKLKI